VEGLVYQRRFKCGVEEGFESFDVRYECEMEAYQGQNESVILCPL
jgi:hypothetical protein